MAIGQDFYPDAGLDDISALSRHQSNEALMYGDQAARYADPFMGERGKYQKQLSDLMADPGSFASSPAYKFAYDEGLNALQRKGGVRSGAKLAALMKYGQDRASQLYGQQAGILSNLAMSGSSPGVAGLSYARGTERSQDYRQMAEAARAAGRQPAQAPQVPQYGLPSGGMSSASSGIDGNAFYPGFGIMSSYSGGGGYGGGMGGYSGGYAMPSGSAGTGYAMNDQTGATYDFGGGGYGGGLDFISQDWGDWGGFDPGAYAEQDYWGYE